MSPHKIWQYATLFLLVSLFSCTTSLQDAEDINSEEAEDNITYSEPVDFDLEEIRERGKLIAISSYSPTSYFIYRGQPMGYEYELLERLAAYLELELEIKIAYNLDNFIEMLNSGEGDLVAHSLSITKSRKKHVDFTNYYSVTRQVLVQRKPQGWRKMKLHEIEQQIIRDPLDLIGKPVYVRKNTSYYRRLINLSQEMGGDIQVEPMDGKLETSEIIKKVAEGEIDYTVADEDIAKINQTYYRDLDVETALSFPQRQAWMVRKTSPKLKAAINAWLEEEKKGTDFYVIYNKYYKNQKRFRTRVSSDYFSLTGGKISEYDNEIQQAAEQLGWDWKLLASQIYQESHFDPETESWAGAIGLMQLMPATARELGDYNLYKADESIEAGVKYLEKLSSMYSDVPDSLERIKFVLATYNAGPGHISDARALAKKHDKDPNVWTGNVDEYILLKAQKEYYSDPVVKHGYCRGEEPYNYVNEIFKRYQVYRDLMDQEGRDDEAVALQKK
ncbi:membrane-bound lytic murein transglycosylase F [Catalinimonas alkaloidigena]|uniref:transporter substrate-binding domain-containing protein n=1 Tax=Catalinimonas alkaloidigena TaxID=1075417 RepID=UPI002405BB2A|nr:transporter substrate-binding domain-containing protein [Catalinimonas alkaloidigena]MDF9795921.1 membrane-bound lytic murein transglycosylase F [Catalinimonas alkaloidigena]